MWIYLAMHAIVLGCAVGELVLAGTHIPFCPEVIADRAMFCDKQYAWLIFVPIWTIILAACNALRWLRTDESSSDYRDVEIVVHRSTRNGLTWAFWIAVVAIAASIKLKTGYILGIIALLLYSWFFATELLPPLGVIVSGPTSTTAAGVMRQFRALGRVGRIPTSGRDRMLQPRSNTPAMAAHSSRSASRGAIDPSMFNPREDWVR